ncbi:MAG: LysR family transcriptional regulator [Lachnospiraceae bacterium]
MTLIQLRYAITVADAGSMNEAAKKLFISQPSLSQSVRELEEEAGIEIFRRSTRGVSVTQEGAEFLGYARQVTEQYGLIESRYIERTNVKKKFGVSMQHYAFAVNAFVEMVKQFGMDEYEFAIRETKTYEVIEDVKSFRSEIGILFLNEFNEKVLRKLFTEAELQFYPLMECGIYAYMWKGHPLAGKEEVSLEELGDYPCLAFEQGNYNSFYFAEEVLSTYDYKQLIRANDRATLLNLMKGLNGYTLCCGIICEVLNGEEYCAVRLRSDVRMEIGYIKRKGMTLSPLGEKYLEEIRQYSPLELKSGRK